MENKQTNASKGAKPISAWSGHSKLGAISEEAQQFLNQKDEAARAAIAKGNQWLLYSYT